MFEWLLLFPLVVIGLLVAGVFAIAASVIWFLLTLPFRLLGWIFGAICFAVFVVPLILVVLLGTIAAVVFLALPVLPLLILAGMVWLVMRLVRQRRAAAIR